MKTARVQSTLRQALASQTWRSWIVVIGAAVVVLLLLTVASPFVINIAQTVVIYSIAALALDWLTGRAGQVSIGNAALLAVGAYTTAIISMSPWGPFPVPLIVSAIFGGAVGLITGLPSLRLTGIHLALATLALQFIVVFVGTQMEIDSGNVGGYLVAPLTIAGTEMTDGRALLIVVLVVLLICVVILRNMYSRLPGRMWRAIKEDEVAAATMGIATVRWKLVAFVGSSAMVSVAGSLFAYQILSVSSATFSLDLALGFVAMLVIGGLQSIPGVVFGVVFVTVAPTIIDSILSSTSSTTIGAWLEPRSSTLSSGIYGLVLLIFLVYRADGVAGLMRDLLGRLARTRFLGAPRPAAPGRSAGSSTSGTAVVGERPTETAAAPTLTVDDAVLRIRDLRCVYSNGACALAGVNLDVARATITAVIGCNGAGKSSLMRSITGFLPAERVHVSGSVQLAGREIAGLPPTRTAALGLILVPERAKIFPGLTVAEHFHAVGSPNGLDAVQSDAFEVLRQRRDSRAGYLSGGERQLLALGIAASLEPSLLLIDEMSLGLAPAMIATVTSAVRDLAEANGITVLVVEQNVAVAEDLASRVCVMDDGIVSSAESLVERELSSAGLNVDNRQ